MMIKTLEEKLRQAMLDSNIPVLDELIADDLIFTMHTGLVVDKQYDLNAHRSGVFQFAKVETDDQQIREYGNFTIVAVKTELAGIHDQQAFSGTYRFTRVWAKHQDRWQIVAGHACQLVPLQS
jgi:ketosteroid isomerase-like protein